PNGKFVANLVRIGPDGTTVTDGFIILRVGLPQGTHCPEATLVPAQLLGGGERSELEVGKETVSVTTGEITQTAPKGKSFSPTERIPDCFPPCQNAVPVDGVSFTVNVDNLARLVEATHKLTEYGRPAKISVWPDMLRIDLPCGPEGQQPF